MATRQDTMMNPSIEDLLDLAGSKFGLVTLSATRARQINAYFNQLGEGLGSIIPPQVTSVARKPLSIAFEEIAGNKIVPTHRGDTADAAGDGPDGERPEPSRAKGTDAPQPADAGEAE